MKSNYADVNVPKEITIPEYVMEHWDQYGNEQGMVSFYNRPHSLVKQGDNVFGSICLFIRPSSTSIAIKIGPSVVHRTPLTSPVKQILQFLKWVLSTQVAKCLPMYR